MAFNDLLSTSFLFSIAIIIILIGGIFAYVSYRMSEQDHKITSMLGLVSTMAEELQFFRSKLSSQNQSAGQAIPVDVPCPEERHVISMLDPNNLVTRIVEPTSLISVSDEESDSNDESVDESDSESDESESNGDEDSGSESDEDQNEEYNLDEIVDLEEPVSLIQNIDECDLNDLDQNLNTNNIKSIHLAEPIDLHDSNQDHDVELLVSDLKTISISDLEDTNKKPEYKKMSLNKLREVVLEKGVVSDASKLKKNDLLKLLGDE